MPPTLDQALDLELVLRELPTLVLRPEENQVRIGTLSEMDGVTICRQKQGWTLRTSHWEGHVTAPSEAIEAALLILGGYARTATEFRGESRSAVWLEVFNGETYERRHTAYGLNPYDEEEWQLWGEEQWRVERHHIRVIDLDGSRWKPDYSPPEPHSFERQDPNPIVVPDDGYLKWTDNVYGPPRPGCKWALDYTHQFLFLIPKGWRRKGDDKPAKWPTVAYAPRNEGLLLRVQTGFRDVDVSLQGSAGPRPVAPREIQHVVIESCADAPEWSMCEWQLEFAKPGEEMYASVYFYHLRESPPGNDFIAAFGKWLQDSRFVVPGVDPNAPPS